MRTKEFQNPPPYPNPENAQIFDYELSQVDMIPLDALDEGKRVSLDPIFIPELAPEVHSERGQDSNLSPNNFKSVGLIFLIF